MRTTSSPAIARPALIRAARSVIDNGGWCVLEQCTDIPHQEWEAVVVICHVDAELVANAITEEILESPEFDARLTGCHRFTLQPDPGLGEHLCYLASV